MTFDIGLHDVCTDGRASGSLGWLVYQILLPMVLRCASFARARAPLLLQIIHHNQNAYVKGRTIFDAVRTIDDVKSFMALKNISSLMIVIDFEKAFDSVN